MILVWWLLWLLCNVKREKLPSMLIAEYSYFRSISVLNLVRPKRTVLGSRGTLGPSHFLGIPFSVAPPSPI